MRKWYHFMLSLLTDSESWGLLFRNSIWNRFQILDESDWVTSPKSVLWDSASCWDCWVWSDDTASLKLSSLHNYRSETNMNVIVNDWWSDVTTMLNIDIITDVDWQGESLFRGPMNRLQNSVIADFSILADSNWIIHSLGDASKTKIRIFGDEDIPNDGGIWSNICWVSDDRLLFFQR